MRALHERARASISRTRACMDAATCCCYPIPIPTYSRSYLRPASHTYPPRCPLLTHSPSLRTQPVPCRPLPPDFFGHAADCPALPCRTPRPTVPTHPAFRLPPPQYGAVAPPLYNTHTHTLRLPSYLLPAAATTAPPSTLHNIYMLDAPHRTPRLALLTRTPPARSYCTLHIYALPEPVSTYFVAQCHALLLRFFACFFLHSLT